MKVHTLKGLIDFEDLEVKEVIAMADNARVIATEWYYRNEQVRRDVVVIVLRPIEIGAEHG